MSRNRHICNKMEKLFRSLFSLLLVLEFAFCYTSPQSLEIERGCLLSLFLYWFSFFWCKVLILSKNSLYLLKNAFSKINFCFLFNFEMFLGLNLGKISAKLSKHNYLSYVFFQ